MAKRGRRNRRTVRWQWTWRRKESEGLIVMVNAVKSRAVAARSLCFWDSGTAILVTLTDLRPEAKIGSYAFQALISNPLELKRSLLT